MGNRFKKALLIILCLLIIFIGIVLTGCEEKSKKPKQPSIILFYNGQVFDEGVLTVYYDGNPKQAPEAKLVYNGEYLDYKSISFTKTKAFIFLIMRLSR